MTTTTEICNRALAALGTRSTITDINEGSAEANACLTWYEAVRDECLQACQWNFARKQIALALLADATAGQTVPTPWMYEYAVPNDVIQMRYIMPQVQANTTGTAAGGTSATPYWVGPPVRFLVSNDTIDGNPATVILTNQSQAVGVYTARIDNPNLYDAQFAGFFSHFLALRICMQLTGDKGVLDRLEKAVPRLNAEAEASNGNEGLTILDSQPDWIRVRGYAADWGYPDGGFYTYGPNLTQIT